MTNSLGVRVALNVMVGLPLTIAFSLIPKPLPPLSVCRYGETARGRTAPGMSKGASSEMSSVTIFAIVSGSVSKPLIAQCSMVSRDEFTSATVAGCCSNRYSATLARMQAAEHDQVRKHPTSYRACGSGKAI